MLAQLIRSHAHPLPTGDDRNGTLAPTLVRACDNGDFEYRRMLENRLFDLDGADVLSTGDDDILGSVADLDIAVWVPDGETPERNHPSGMALAVASGSL